MKKLWSGGEKVNHIEEKSSIFIEMDRNSVWDAIIDENQLSKWYAPGSFWEIPNLSVGEKAYFTLMPSAHNNLTEKVQMTLTIAKVTTYHELSLYLDSQQSLLSLVLEEEGDGTRVTMNSKGYEMSLANLKALLNGEELPYS